MNGWSELGAALGGGGRSQEALYQQGQLNGMRQADLLEQARTRRDKNLGLAAITPASFATTDPITGATMDPSALAAQQQSLASAFAHAGIPLNELGGYQKDRQGISFRDQAMTDARSANPDQNQLNRVLSVIDGKPMITAAVQGNVSLNPHATVDSQPMNPTQVGLSDIAAKMAQATASNAAAGEHNAQAGAARAHARLFNTQSDAGGFNPLVGAAGNTKPSLAPVGALNMLLGKPDKFGDMKADPANVQNFMAWQGRMAAQDPQYKNGAYAAQKYAELAPAGSGLAGSNPGDVAYPITPGHGGTYDTSASSDMGDAMGGGNAKSKSAALSPSPGGPSAGSKPSASSVPSGTATPKTPAEYNALPSGTLFVNPSDGSLRRKK